MKIKVICIGTLKEKSARELIKEYTKRISRFSKVEIIELSEAPLPKNAGEKAIEAALEKEADAIESKIGERDYVVALCVEKKMLSSTELADKVKEVQLQGYNSIDFIIGSSFGLSERIKNKANLCLSFSKMTFPHQLMRIILLEQIYRVFKINNNETYHK